MEVSRKKINRIFQDLGFANAPEWDDPELFDHVRSVFPKVMFAPGKLSDKQKALVREITTARARGQEIRFLSDSSDETPSSGATEKKSKKEKPENSSGKKKGKDVAKVKNKGKKSKDKGEKPKKKSTGMTKPGIIATVIEFLKMASKKKPLTVDTCIQKVLKKFPDRQESSLRNTITSQLSSQLRANKDMDVRKHPEGGYYLGKG